DDGVKWSDLVQPPGQSPAIAVKLVPRHRKGFSRPFLGAQFRHHSGHVVSIGCSPGRSDAPPVSESSCPIGLHELHKESPSSASISFTAAIAALSFSGSRERTTRLVFGFWFSSRNG